ncbi:histidinol-phosphate transaminase [Sporosarcina sp. HYO08]|uniref:pyridoxal phosphate-dependent aminotransferase n=1 Tax=Sporosarcina sp. HYO08 TaxID=1759557 RepID=UPI0007927975|nr:aminotransferase class I/II-fold pyridoxal phosphate-dependent enzyme [Sporosarcina sp. HYO08]KXH83943.1 threonine-phosphate decarboxylase [Sporosarcina sp. HYO08]
MRLPEHGANPHHVYEKLGLTTPDRLIDLSENCNPAGPPFSVLKAWHELVHDIQMYPDPNGEPFITAASDYHELPKSYLFAGNGAAELLALMAERYRGKRAVLVHPTFSEYERTLLAKDVSITHIVASETNGFQLPVGKIIDAMQEADVLYLCTPNNPTGIMPSRDELLQVIRYGEKVNCDIVLDEAFIDFVDELLSFIPEIVHYPHVIVVRSMTKMYAIPGLRLGYVAADPSIIQEIRTVVPHWNINGLAAKIGAICFQEDEYRQTAMRHADNERQKLKKQLNDLGFIFTDSVTNYVAFTTGSVERTTKLYTDLLTRGIILRHSKNFRGMDGRWLRVGVKNEADMQVFMEELSKWKAEN